jgi:hypothetical protein
VERIEQEMSEKSTGKHSPINRFKSHCLDFSEHTRGKYTPEDIATLIKAMSAMYDNYPQKKTLEFKYKGKKVESVTIPRSMADASDIEIGIAQNTLQAWADENGWWLTEYDDKEQPYRSVGGQTREQMKMWCMMNKLNPDTLEPVK